MKHLMILFLFVSTIILPQELKISGKVVTSEGNPLYLANVFIQDEDLGTTTNIQGEFNITGNIKRDDLLVFSYLGYKTKELEISEISDLTDVLIELESEILSSQTVLVEGSIGREGTTPITFSKVKREEIEESYINQDLPEYLSYLPSTTFYSENGNGIGYNYLSIRGFDQRRISISVNGIPQNEPEDHNIYWLDMPDLLESTELIQVQRGAGSGVIGYPAIGGSINIITANFSDQKKVEISAVTGSYNTRKYRASFSSGLINNKYSIYAKIGKTLSSGYRNLSWVDFNSYHLSAVRYDKNLTTQINFYGGQISDGLAYTGLPKSYVEDRDLRKLNYSYWWYEGEDVGAIDRRPVEKEEFSQPHYELLNEYRLNKNLTFNSALFLIIGNGYFDYDGSWADTNYFRLTNDFGFNPEGNPGNALIRAKVENKQWGWIPRFKIDHGNGSLIIGGEFRFHNSIHWGSIEYADNLPAGVDKEYKYYYYEGGKNILNAFINEQFSISEKLNLLAEAQFSYHKYEIKNERYIGTNFTLDKLFFNPRLGINYKLNSAVNIYTSVARVSREPRLKNYYDAAESSGGAVPQFELNNGIYNFEEPLVKPETMNNLELGANYNTAKASFSLNLFYMNFNDEIVKQGQIDRFGQPITGNIKNTVHSGIELTGDLNLNKNFELILNGSYSKNYISEGSTFVGYDEGTAEIDFTDNRISGFPDVTFNGILKFKYEGFLTQVYAKYVGSFYSDNYDENLGDYLNKYPGFLDYEDNKVEAYFVSNIAVSYELDSAPYFQRIKIFGKVNNIFDNLYAAYAIGKEFFPAAERNFLIGIELGL